MNCSGAATPTTIHKFLNLEQFYQNRPRPHMGLYTNLKYNPSENIPVISVCFMNILHGKEMRTIRTISDLQNCFWINEKMPFLKYNVTRKNR